jgi:hypothetical protein
VLPTNTDARLTDRVPAFLGPLGLPSGVEPAAVWVSPEGEGLVAARDGRLLAVDVYGEARALERLPGDRVGEGEAPATAVVERAAGVPLVLVPGGGLVVEDGWLRRAELPSLLRGARAMTAWGAEALWATAAGLYTTQGDRWYQLEREGAALTDVVALVAGPSDDARREAWVLRADGALYRLRVTVTGTSLTVLWSDPVVGLAPGRVSAIARLGDDRYFSRAGDLLRVTPAGAVSRVRIPGEYRGPSALTAAGPWLWAVWDLGERGVDVGRIDARNNLEMVARGVMPFGGAITETQRVSLAVDPTRGDTAYLALTAEVTGAPAAGDAGRGDAAASDAAVDAPPAGDATPARDAAPAGDVGVTRQTVALRVVVEPRVALVGFADGQRVTEARLPLRAAPPEPGAVESVTWLVDEMRAEELTAPPFGWGPQGRLYRDLPMLDFGEHTVEVVVRYRGAEELRRARTFTYVSPLGRVPTYERDVLPVYTTRCARCHSTGIARDLRGYERFRSMAPLVSAALLARRMPPDLAVDQPTVLLFTAWVAGGTPR